MKGRLLKGQSSTKGFFFCRLILLIGFTTLIIFPVVFILLVPGSVEIWWDRILMLVAVAGVFLYSYRKDIPLQRHYRNYYILSAAYTFHILINSSYNGFEQNHFFAFLLVFACVGLSYRYLRGGVIYISLITIIAGILFLISDLDPREKGLGLFWTVLFGSMLYMFLFNKSSFVRNEKVKGELLRTIASKTEDVILLTDLDGFIIDHNPRATEVLGYSEDELLTIDFNTFRKTELTDQEIDDGLQILKEDRFWKEEVTLKRKDGSTFIGFVTITLIRKYNNESLVFRISDITQTKQAEAELIRAKNEAEEATQAKSEFLATMSHEIRTPMNGVVGMASVLMNSKLDTEQQMQVRTIKRSGENLMVILNDILDMSKVESGKMMLEEHDFDFREMIDEVYHLLSIEAKKKNIDFQTDVSEHVPERIIADSMRMRQVLVNLMSNAIKFTEKGKVCLKVDAERISDEEHQLFFKVDDTGIGIPKEKLQKLFESFTQVDSSTTRKYGGTGLGLAISKRLVELMNGKIQVKSELGEGTCFTFNISSREAPPLSSDQLDKKENLGKLPEDLNELRILVAEDNKVNCQVIKLMLESLGTKADFVETGKEVVEACKRSSFDIIFMDVQMPEMDGLEATRIILKELDPNVHIIAMTANVMSEDRQDCLEAGMKDFLTKPVMMDTLEQKLETFIAQQKKIGKRA